MRELASRHHELLKYQEMSPSCGSQEALLASRRQLESLRQRLQLEASKFQVSIYELKFILNHSKMALLQVVSHD